MNALQNVCMFVTDWRKGRTLADCMEDVLIWSSAVWAIGVNIFVADGMFLRLSPHAACGDVISNGNMLGEEIGFSGTKGPRFLKDFRVDLRQCAVSVTEWGGESACPDADVFYAAPEVVGGMVC